MGAIIRKVIGVARGDPRCDFLVTFFLSTFGRTLSEQ